MSPSNELAAPYRAADGAGESPVRELFARGTPGFDESMPDGRPAAPERRVPPPPTSLEDAGLSEELVAGLAVKVLHLRGSALGLDLADVLALPVAIVDDVVEGLQEERLVEVVETRGPRRGEWVFRLTGAGRRRAVEELEISRYVGAAPVPFEDFRRWVELQAVEDVHVCEDDLRRAFEGAVVQDDMLELLGPALNSGRSLFLYGSPGNGKTLLAERIARLFGREYYVPYTVLVDGHVMIVYDPVQHGKDAQPDGAPRAATFSVAVAAERDADGARGDGARVRVERGPADDILRAPTTHDRRFARARRPVVITGGELTLNQLDLQWDPSGRMYQAPPQLKAAGGVLVIDDLGRQRVPVRDLLNRWVVPLEQRRDYLTLRSGRKVDVPFDCFVIFSTNLEPKALGDEAFLRRIHYKVEVPGPDRDEYTRIFRHCCEERGIVYHQHAVDWLFDTVYDDGGTEPRRCHPRDVLDHLCDLASYRDETASLTPQLLERACRSYFLPVGDTEEKHS